MAKWNGGYTWDTPPSATGAPARLTVASCQIPVGHDIPGNAALIDDLVGRAAASGADVAHFPECALSGYGPEAWPDWSGFPWPDLDAAVARLREAARRRGIWVVAGSVDRTTDSAAPVNGILVVGRGGEIVGRYAKRRCSTNDLRAFAPGDRPLTLDIEGVRCGFLVCLDWAFPELWQEHAGAATELVFLSCASDGARRDRNAAHTIPPLMRSYAWLFLYAVSVANSCRPRQDFPSFWVERSGHAGKSARRDEAGLVLNALADDPEQDRFFAMVRRFRQSATDGSLYRGGTGT